MTDTQLRTWIADFLLDCQVTGLSPRTIVWYRSNLRQFQGFAQQQGWSIVTTPELRAYVTHLRERKRCSGHATRQVEEGHLSAHSVAGHIRTLKRFFNWLTDEGLIAANPAAALKLPRLPRAAPRGVALADAARLWRAATNDRDRALIWFLIDTGCRVAELCALRWADVQLEQAQGMARVRGKGHQERFVFLEEPTVAALRAAQKPPADRVFTGQRGPLTPNGAYQILRRLKDRAGVSGRCHPHAFRHAFGREWVMSDGDLSSLSDKLGHSDISVTRIYSVLPLPRRREKHRRHSSATRLREAVRQLDAPEG